MTAGKPNTGQVRKKMDFAQQSVGRGGRKKGQGEGRSRHRPQVRLPHKRRGQSGQVPGPLQALDERGDKQTRRQTDQNPRHRLNQRGPQFVHNHSGKKAGKRKPWGRLGACTRLSRGEKRLIPIILMIERRISVAGRSGKIK